MKLYDCKNKITLYTGEDHNRVELYDFDKLEHIMINGVSNIRITCGNRYYYFKTIETAISEIEIYN